MTFEESRHIGTVLNKELAQSPLLVNVMCENNRMTQLLVPENPRRLEVCNNFGADIINRERSIGRRSQLFRKLHQNISPVLSGRKILPIRSPQIPPQPEQLHFRSRKLILPLGARQAQYRVQKEWAAKDYVGIARLPEKRPQPRKFRGDYGQFFIVEPINVNGPQRQLFQRIGIEPCFKMFEVLLSDCNNNSPLG